MKKITFAFYMLFSTILLFAQNDPYILDGNGNGLGQYGYLEHDATTFTSLHRNSHGNVRHLGARWWVTDGSGGQEYVYWTTPNDGGWQCNGINDDYKTTDNYDPANFNGEWIPGSDCYVSVYAEYCDGNKNPNGGTGTGYNERHFKVFDFDNTPYTDVVDNVLYDAGGDCNHDNLVGSFIIDIDTVSNVSLTRFWFKSIGTAAEGTDIPNDAFKVFYEPATGSETFDKTEDSFPIYGDYGGNSTSNNEYGNDAVSAAISGKTRFYVTMCKANSPSVNGKTVELVVLNDGLSFDPLLDSHGLFRIAETNITNKAITIPITLIDYSAKLSSDKKSVSVTWSTTNEINNSHFNIYKSHDGENWSAIGSVESRNEKRSINKYSFIDESPLNGLSYYKLEQVDLDGKSTFYNVVSVVNNSFEIDIYPNPVNDKLYIISKVNQLNIEIINNIGQIVKVVDMNNKMELDITTLNTGIYRIVFRDINNKFVGIKAFIKK